MEVLHKFEAHTYQARHMAPEAHKQAGMLFQVGIIALQAQSQAGAMSQAGMIAIQRLPRDILADLPRLDWSNLALLVLCVMKPYLSSLDTQILSLAKFLRNCKENSSG